MVDLEAAGRWRLEQRDGIAAAAVRPHKLLLFARKKPAPVLPKKSSREVWPAQLGSAFTPAPNIASWCTVDFDRPASCAFSLH